MLSSDGNNVTGTVTVTDVAGNTATFTSASFKIDTKAPAVTINQAAGQVDPTGASPINFTVAFSEAVYDFVPGDVTLNGSAGATTATITYVSPDQTTYTVAVSGMTGSGTVVASLAAGVAHDVAGNASAASTSDDNSVNYLAPTQIAGTYVFYNNCKWDGHSGLTNGDPAANQWDDNAIAPDKTPLLPGGTGSFGNYTSYTKGLNGLMVDIAGLAGRTPTAADFQFKVGNTNTPSSWAAAPPPSSVTVRPGAGVGGSDRVTVIWADNAIYNTWLQVTVLADANTGLTANSVFYWGNQRAETGNNLGNTRVDANDVSAIQAYYSYFNSVSITSPYDVNRDKSVSAGDVSATQACYTWFGPSLIFLAAPAGPALLLDGPLSLASAMSGLGGVSAARGARVVVGGGGRGACSERLGERDAGGPPTRQSGVGVGRRGGQCRAAGGQCADGGGRRRRHRAAFRVGNRIGGGPVVGLACRGILAISNLERVDRLCWIFALHLLLQEIGDHEALDLFPSCVLSAADAGVGGADQYRRLRVERRPIQ